jgi:hypothetical protein
LLCNQIPGYYSGKRLSGIRPKSGGRQPLRRP